LIIEEARNNIKYSAVFSEFGYNIKKSYILSDYEELESDIVYKATIENKEVIFYILLEF